VRRAWAQLYFELFPYRRPHATIPIRPSQQPSRMTIPIQPSHTTFSKDDSHTTISIRLCSHTTLSTTIPARVSSYDHARTMPFMFPSQASIQTTIPIRPPFPYNDYPHTTMPMRSTPYDRFHTTIHTRPSTHDHPHTTIHTRPSTHDHSHTTIHKRPFTHDHSHTTTLLQPRINQAQVAFARCIGCALSVHRLPHSPTTIPGFSLLPPDIGTAVD
jgi:hypothetical protein